MAMANRERKVACYLARRFDADRCDKPLISHDSRGQISAPNNKPWSNGRREGQINKLKTLKCQMYGRANLDPLRASLVVSV